MAQIEAALEFHVVEISKSELIIRLIEASTGIPADEILNGFVERSPLVCEKMEACAMAAVSYFAECMRAAIPSTTLSETGGAIQ